MKKLYITLLLSLMSLSGMLRSMGQPFYKQTKKEEKESILTLTTLPQELLKEITLYAANGNSIKDAYNNVIHLLIATAHLGLLNDDAFIKRLVDRLYANVFPKASQLADTEKFLNEGFTLVNLLSKKNNEKKYLLDKLSQWLEGLGTKRDTFLSTLMKKAIISDNPRPIKYLVECGADVHDFIYGGKTALICAAENGHEGIVKYLVDHGADVHDFIYGGKTALICAAENGHEGIVKYLVDHGADVHAFISGGKTALICAAENGHEGIVKYLVDHGADVNTFIYGGKTARDIAEEKGYTKIVEILDRAAEKQAMYK